MKDNQAYNSSISVTTLLGLVFIVLKLTHVIDWSWWWVLSPFWIPLTVVLVVLLAIAIVLGMIILAKINL